MDKLEIVQLYQKTYPQVSREIAKKGTINGVWELHFKDSFINHIKWMIKDDMVNLIKSVCFTMLTPYVYSLHFQVLIVAQVMKRL